MIQNLANEFNDFLKDYSVELCELEQANFISSSNGLINLENIVNNNISDEFKQLLRSIIFTDLDFYIRKIQQSHFSLIDKKNMLFLLIATRSEKYLKTLPAKISENERLFLNTYLKKSKDFVEFCIKKDNAKELAIFLYDINAFRKFLKKDAFLMPIKLENAFNWTKKDSQNPKEQLIKTKNILFNSRRKFYYKLNIHKSTITEYNRFNSKIDNILKKF